MTVELHDRLQRLETWESPEIPVISLYLNLRPAFEERKTVAPRLRNLLEPISEQAKNLDHDGREALRQSVARVLAREPEIAANTGHCVALFVGGRPELDEFVTLPRKAWDTAVALPRPYLRPYLATLDQFHLIAAVVVDPRLSSVTLSYMGEVLDHTEIESPPIRKSDFAGWQGLDEHRVRHHADEVHRRQYRQVAEHLQRLGQEHEIDVIFVGGREEAVAAFLHQLPAALGSQVAATFTIDLHTATPAQIAKITAELEARFEEQEEQNLVTSVLEASRAGGLGVVGLEDTLQAANLGAVDLLLIGGTEMVPGYTCGNCGWLDLKGPVCPSCGETSTASPDIVESLAVKVRRASARAEHVLTPSDLNGIGVGARLRFPLPSGFGA